MIWSGKILFPLRGKNVFGLMGQFWRQDIKKHQPKIPGFHSMGQEWGWGIAFIFLSRCHINQVSNLSSPLVGLQFPMEILGFSLLKNQVNKKVSAFFPILSIKKHLVIILICIFLTTKEIQHLYIHVFL